jgi:cell division protein FtsI (penicillin-binding protein 3)
MRSLLLGVVQKGTGSQAKIESLSIGGKTGTSKIIVDGKYSNNHYYSSFIGFYPAEIPVIVCYVLISKPKGHYYGGLVSAPVFKNILTRIYELEKGKYDEPKPSTDIKIAVNKNQKSDYDFVHNEIKNGSKSVESRNVITADNKQNLMPDLTGKTLKEALTILKDLGIKWSISGSGVVAEQSIPPGQTINKRNLRFICSQISSSGARRLMCGELLNN